MVFKKHLSSLPLAILTSITLLACSDTKKGFDPCTGAMGEEDEIRKMEVQLIRLEKQIYKYRSKNDTASLHFALRERDILLENRKDAQIAARNMSYSCEPWYPGTPPFDPTQTREEQKRKNGW